MTTPLTAPPRWWQWPTVLSLDAPMVCLLWQALIARAVAADLRWPHVVILATSVWLAYAADRWIEGFRLDTRLVRTQRHGFYQRRRRVVAVAWLAVLAGDVTIAAVELDRADFLAGLVLILPVLAYLFSHQLVHRDAKWRAPKEVLIAMLLTAGVVVFLRPIQRPDALLLPAAVFAALAFTNCALISAWERDVDRTHGQSSLALDVAWSVRAIGWLPWVLAIVGAATLPEVARGPRVLLSTGIASALMLALVDRAERRLGWAAARVLADFALLTPAVPLLWMR